MLPSITSLLLQISAVLLNETGHAVPYSYIGCYKDIRHEWVFFWWASHPMNARDCAAVCESNRFGYFGMAGGWGRDCHCGNSGYDKHGTMFGCIICFHQYQFFNCGLTLGDTRLLAVHKITSGSPTTDERFIGCWSAGNASEIVGTPVQVGSGIKMDVSQCTKACMRKMATYAGIMNGGMGCYCGNDLQWEGDGRIPMNTWDCYENCADGSPCGGGGNRISLYRAVCLVNEHCLTDVSCDNLTGVCPGFCENGWMGSYPGGPCVKECSNGYFGVNCTGRCHCENMVPCDKFNGPCPGVCAPTYGGPTCSDLLEVCDLSKNISDISYTRLQRKPNMAVLGYDIAQFTAPLYRCVETCQKDSLCGSFNYEKSTKSCELKAYCRHKLTSIPGVHYIE